MTSSPLLNVVLLLAFLALELALLSLVGELAGRALARISLWRARLPEISFLIGYAAFSLTGYAALPFTRSSKGILPAVCLAMLAAWAYTRTYSLAVPDWMQPYLAFRRTRPFLFAAAGLLLFSALVTGFRVPWLIHFSLAGRVVSGTPIWDDARTLGIPLALAAYGFPLRSPLAMGMHLAYPLGAFLFPAGLMAWLPAWPLPIELADVATQSILYSLTTLFLSTVLFRSGRAITIALLAATVSVSFNLWQLHPAKGSHWLETFYGYYRYSGQVTTIGWTAFGGLLWIPNHAIAFCAMLLAAFWLIRDPEKKFLGIPLLFAAFAAVTSVDFTLMSLAAVGLILLYRLARNRKALFNDPLLRTGVLLGLTSFALVVWVNLPTLNGVVDSPFDPAFPLNTAVRYNTGLLASHTGPYLAMMIAAGLILRRLGFPGAWLTVIATGFAFAFIFEYHSIWCWRFTFAAHLLLGFAAAWQFDKLPLPAQRWFFPLWLLFMAPGAYQLKTDFMASVNYAAWTSPDRAQAMDWIESQTPLRARVTEYRIKDASLTADPSLLRAGNRGGDVVYDRSHPLIGYRDYAATMKDLAGTLASNDFVLVPGDVPELKRLLEHCSQPRFANRAAAVFEITAECRRQLVQPSLHGEVERLQRRLSTASLLASGTEPAGLPSIALGEYVAHHPDKAFLMRRRMDKLWQQGKFDEALKAMEPVLEAHPELGEMNYCYAFSLHVSGKDPHLAVEYYTRALDNGFDPFWTRYNRGAALILAKQPARARQDLEAARKLNPTHTGVLKLIAELSGK